MNLSRRQQTAAPVSVFTLRGPPVSSKEDGKLQGTGASQERKKGRRKVEAQSTGKNRGGEEEL